MGILLARKDIRRVRGEPEKGKEEKGPPRMTCKVRLWQQSDHQLLPIGRIVLIWHRRYHRYRGSAGECWSPPQTRNVMGVWEGFLYHRAIGGILPGVDDL